MINFLKKLVNYFDTYNIKYMLSGSVAMSLYTEPRFTRDFDFVVHLGISDIENLVNYFKDDYYCDSDAVKEAIERKSKFNIIDPKINYKADFVILKDDEFSLTEFERRKKIIFLDMKIYIVSVEDLLLSKLIWIQEITSSTQMDDIEKLSQNKELDWNYINFWIKQLKLNTFNLLTK